MDSRSGSGDISDDCGELSRLRRERHMLLLRVNEGRINVVAGGGGRELLIYFTGWLQCIKASAGLLTRKLWNDGRRILVQVIHSSCDGVGRHRHSRHDHPAVIRVQAGRQARQPRVIDYRKAAKLLDLLPAVQPLPQACRYLWQGFPVKHALMRGVYRTFIILGKH